MDSTSSAVWSFLSAFGPKPLFPNLQSVHHWEWECCLSDYRQRASIQSPCLLFGLKLEKAELGCTDPRANPDHATELVHALSGVATALRDLCIEAKHDDHWDPTTGSLRCAHLGLFQRLTSFSSSTARVAPDALMALSSLPRLESLLLHANPAEYPWDALPHGRRRDFFPALLRNTLHEIDFNWCTAFLRAISSMTLREVSLRCEHRNLPPPNLLGAICSAISELPSVRSVVQVSFNIGTTFVQDELGGYRAF